MSNYSDNLLELYAKSENPECEGCKVLKSSKPFYCAKDYTKLGEAEVLFLTDSYRYNGWNPDVFSDQEREFFEEKIQIPLLNNIKFVISPAVKCPSVKEADMGAVDMKVCRKYLEQTVAVVKPKLIIPMGNLAMKMLIKKSGITNKHGSEFEFEGIPVVPTFGTAILFIEPKYETVIIQDVKLALNKFINKTIKKIELNYDIITSYAQFEDIIQKHNLYFTKESIAFDIETEGLNFLTDKILTLALSYNTSEGIRSVCIPFYHKESVIPSEDFIQIKKALKTIFNNPDNIKVGHNAKFDIKFLMLEGIANFNNVWDTKSLAHSIDEYSDKGLIDLVKKYLPETLEVL
jgi:uracil-DNA glycosylase family 4